MLPFINFSDDKGRLRDIIESREDYKSVDVSTIDIINTYTSATISKKEAEGGRVDMCQAIQGIFEDGKIEGREEGEKLLAKLIKLLTPGTKEYDKALNGTTAERKKLYKKYKIID